MGHALLMRDLRARGQTERLPVLMQKYRRTAITFARDAGQCPSRHAYPLLTQAHNRLSEHRFILWRERGRGKAIDASDLLSPIFLHYGAGPMHQGTNTDACIAFEILDHRTRKPQFLRSFSTAARAFIILGKTIAQREHLLRLRGEIRKLGLYLGAQHWIARRGFLGWK